MNSRSASIVGDQEAGGSSSFAWCNRQWLSSQALTRRSSGRPKQAVFNHNLLWLPESNGYPHLTIYVVIDRRQLRHRTPIPSFHLQSVLPSCVSCNSFVCHLL